MYKSELEDYITAQKGKIAGQQSVFGHWSTFVITSLDKVSSEKITYFSVLKKTKQDSLDQYDKFNSISCIYRVEFTDRNDDKFTVFCSISANNIVKLPDGSVKWGSKNFDEYDFLCNASDKGLEDCISTCIMSNSDNYNISKVSID